MAPEGVIVVILAATVHTMPEPTSSGCQCAMRKVLLEASKIQCPPICACIFKPVCGFNPCETEDKMFRTFPNECELEGTLCDGVGNLYYSMYEGRCIMDHQDATSCLFLPD